MSRLSSISTVALSLIGVCGVAVATAHAQADYPNRVIKIVAAVPPGGITDTIARFITAGLREKFNISAVVENISGASGQIGTTSVKKSDPDGYTLIMASATSHVVSPQLNRNPPFNPIADFTPVTRLVGSNGLLMVSKSVAAKTPQELVAYIKANPGKLSFGSAGIGSLNHLAMELFKKRLGLDIVHVPYRGNGPASLGLAQDEVQLLYSDLGTIRAQIDAGMVRPIAQVSEPKFEAYPDLPTVSETVVPGFDMPFWVGLLGPANMPAPLVKALNEKITAVMNDATIKMRLKDLAFDFVAGSPEEFAQVIARDTKFWADIIRENNLAQ